MPDEPNEVKPGSALVDLIIRFFVFQPWILNSGISVLGYGTLPITTYALSQIISVQLLPLSAFPKLETAATWLLWIFIGLMFAGAGWKQMLLMLAIGGVAMGFLSSLGVFAVADSEIAASYNDLVQNTKMKNQTASGVSNVWLMLSNPRLWYETQYGYKNDTLAQGDQTSPFALEITKAEVLEKVAPPDGTVTLDVQVKNKGLRDATLKRIDVGVEDANLGNYDRWKKSVATVDTNRDAGYLYFESTPDDEAHYYFCDNGYYKGTDSGGFTWSAGDTASIRAEKTFPAGKFEPGVIDEYFATVNSPKCYGKQRLNVSATYSYNVTATYNLELINKDYFTELAKYNKLKFHTEASRSSEGPLKLTIRSVPEEQPVRADTAQGITVFYSLSNVGPGTAVIKNPGDIYLDGIDTDLALSDTGCNFVVTKKACPDGTVACANIAGVAVKNFYTSLPNKVGLSNKDCTFTKGTDTNLCLTFSTDDPNSVVLLKCTFKYGGSFDTTKTLFMKMHVNYDYITSRTAQYETTPMPGFHSCVTKRELDGFPNKTAMDLYLKEIFKGVEGSASITKLFSSPCWGSGGISSAGTESARTSFCTDSTVSSETCPTYTPPPATSSGVSTGGTTAPTPAPLPTPTPTTTPTTQPPTTPTAPTQTTGKCEFQANPYDANTCFSTTTVTTSSVRHYEWYCHDNGNVEECWNYGDYKPSSPYEPICENNKGCNTCSYSFAGMEYPMLPGNCQASAGQWWYCKDGKATACTKGCVEGVGPSSGCAP